MLLRVEATTFWFLVRLKFFHRPMGATSLTDLLSKHACLWTKSTNLGLPVKQLYKSLRSRLILARMSLFLQMWSVGFFWAMTSIFTVSLIAQPFL